MEHPVGERAEDRLLAQMQGVIAEYERAKILERTRRGRLHKLRAGQILPFSGHAPYGYAIVEGERGVPPTLVIDEVEAQQVRSMYRWVIEEGLSARAVARRLNEHKVRPRSSEVWTQSSAYHVLTNPAYIGIAAYGKRECCEPQRPRHPGTYRKRVKSSMRERPEAQWTKVPVPPILDARMQEQVRVALAKNKVTSCRNTRHEYLLRTLVICGDVVAGWRASASASTPTIASTSTTPAPQMPRKIEAGGRDAPLAACGEMTSMQWSGKRSSHGFSAPTCFDTRSRPGARASKR